MKSEPWLRNRVEWYKAQIVKTAKTPAALAKLSIVIQNLILAELEEVLRD